MDATKAIELIRIYTLEHGKEMSPDELEAHTTAVETMQTFECVKHQWELMRQHLDKADNRDKPKP